MQRYSTRDVARLLGLTQGQIRAYAREGFLAPERGPRNEYRFNFQDVVILRAAAGLVAARIPASRIRAALRSLKQQLPHGRQLSEVRIAAAGERILVSDGGTPWHPESGQLHFDFAVSELATRVAPLARGAADATRPGAAARSADAWYDLAIELEAYAIDEARRAYERALELEPSHADAHVNLGRLLHEAGDPQEAALHYRRALAAGQHPIAEYNLGVALEDLGRRAEAVAAYERATAADPWLADAYYNAARLYEQQGDRASALRCLSEYRRRVS
ncbi:MAG: tetratricopeptide repeat protein [Longimicrobiales bacterium]